MEDTAKALLNGVLADDDASAKLGYHLQVGRQALADVTTDPDMRFEIKEIQSAIIDIKNR